MSTVPSPPALLVALLLVLSACSSDGSASPAGEAEAPAATTTVEATTTLQTTTTEPTTTTEAPAYPVVLEALNGTVTIESRPERIVSLSPSATEILFAIGAGDQVVAVDSLSNHPPEAPTTDLAAFEPNVEAISAYEPDLLIVGFDPENALTEAFARLGVPVLLQPAALTVEDTYAQIAELGTLTDRTDRATAVTAEVQARVDAAVASAGSAGGQPVRVYHELDDTFYSVSSASFIGDLYRRLGFENVADAADPDGFGYPQLSPEYLIEADPELIVITDLVGYTAADVAARPGWDVITAVRNGDIEQVSSDIASRWGPRVADLAEGLAELAVQVRTR